MSTSMTLLEFLPSPPGLALIALLEAVLFSMMIYILAAEYIRTRRGDLIFKLSAGSSITTIFTLTALVYYLQFFHGIGDVFVRDYFPLISNSLFAIVVLMLARAFIYDFLANQRAFDWFFRINLAAIVIGYAVLQYMWLQGTDDPNRGSFANSSIQIVFGIYFIVVLGIIISMTLIFRKKYRVRLVIAFAAILFVQVCLVIRVFTPLPPVLIVLQSAAPLLIPVMFGSTVFKELIDSNVTMTLRLREVFDNQGELIHELNGMSGNLSKISEEIFNKSGESWMRLTEIKSLADKQETTNEDLNQKIRHHSRDIEEMAGLTDHLKDLIGVLNKKTGDLDDMNQKISFINK